MFYFQGKSSLINAIANVSFTTLLQRSVYFHFQHRIARTSNTPGRTQEASFQKYFLF
jgi:GTP-binding protein EngB required for normal cell division